MLALAAIAPPLAAQEATGSASAGQELVSKLCASCHIVGTERVGSDVAPPFVVIARNSEMTLSALHAWVGPEHPMLRNLALTRQQIADINAYLDSLHGEQTPRVETEEPPPVLKTAPPEKLGEPIPPRE
jgi:cytochrome c553